MMSMIKKSLKIFGLTVFLVSSNAYAADISVGGSSVSVNDRGDIGDGSSAANGYMYNINQMDVKWASDNTITVDVFTNFSKIQKTNYKNYEINHNNRYGSGSSNRNIIFGDLLIDTSNANGSNSYAFSLGDLYNDWNTRFSRIERLGQNNGGLYAINGTTSAGSYHGYDTAKGSVFGNTIGKELNKESSSWSSSNGKISFSFNVGGIDAFKNATSLSLSWAMSCFNDAVHDTFAVNRGNKPAVVPEPSTIILMLLALIGITYRQKSKRNSFSA